MTMEAHDPTNNRTLDLSGNGRHLTLGDGSTAGTFPTKLVDKRGYKMDIGNTDYFRIPGSAVPWTSNRVTFEAYVTTVTNDTGGYYIYFGQGTSTATPIVITLNYTAGNIKFYSGLLSSTVYAAQYAVSQGNTVQRGHIVGRYNGTTTDLFFNGNIVATAATPTAPSASASNLLILGARWDITSYQVDTFWHAARLWEVALTDTEIQELYRKAKEELHRI
jgi:hypothetical protein